jgi:type I restriction enzyme S subunit
MDGEAFIDCTVSELAAQTRNSLVGGPFGSDLVSKDYVPTGVPVIRGTNMGHGRWVDGEFAYVTPEKAESLSSNCAKPGDIVFTQRGTLGQVALVPKKGADRYLISQSQMKLTVDAEKADPMFRYYIFSSAEQQDYIRQNAIQTGVPHTNLGILRNTPLTLPPLAKQKGIAAVLGALDDKIELNRRMNATLEAMARALFQSWFVDFDPVRAKLDGREPFELDPDTPTGRWLSRCNGWWGRRALRFCTG